jgi:chromosomal replication initiator protein
MVKDCTTIWNNCLETVRGNINEQSFRTWFEPIKPIRLDEAVLTIQVPNQFFYEWLEEHYVQVLKKAIRKELGEKARLEYQIRLERETKPNAAVSQTNGSSKSTSPDTPVPDLNKTEIRNPFVIPGIRKPQIESNLSARYLLENYIEGDCNRLARAAAEAVALKPGGTAFNPLVIFGDVGLGKTHLAQAVGNAIIGNKPNLIVLYITTEQFTNQIIHAIRTNAAGDFVNWYQQIDVLIVDDIQFLANRDKTQEIFFHVFNQLHQAGKQIILTSDRPPKELAGMSERLISRFKWGLSADLSAPDFETRVAILEAKLDEVKLRVPKEVIDYVCFNISGNIRELEGVIAGLVARTSLTGRNIDVRLAQEVIHDFLINASSDITIDKINHIVADYFSMDVDRLRSQTRKREVVTARQAAMYLCKKLAKEPLKAIGLAFGGRDHSTVIYACRSVNNLMETDPKFRALISDLERQVHMSMAG